jgi:putative endonuclease
VGHIHNRPRCPQPAPSWSRLVGSGGDSVGMAAKDAVGRYGERVAVDFLVRQGMRLIARNWRCSVGEIDAILRDGDTIVFAEVKTRRSERYGSPADAVGWVKQARLRHLAAIWLARADINATEVRFDLISVLPQSAGAAGVEHLKGAF